MKDVGSDERETRTSLMNRGDEEGEEEEEEGKKTKRGGGGFYSALCPWWVTEQQDKRERGLYLNRQCPTSCYQIFPR